MFWAIVAIIILSFVGTQHEMDYCLHKKNPVLKQYEYEYKVQKDQLKEEYEKSILPKSGFMLMEEYEKESKGIENENRVVEERKYPKPADMKYVPQPTYKLVRYNNPPGTPELNIPRRIEFERQVNTQGIISGDFTKLVYSSVYYYPKERCTACDVFVIPLDTTVNRIERVQKANVIKKEPKPIFSTIKDVSQEGAFRTITPVDFSEDNRYIVAKEKTGYIFDGIWKTELLVHDFATGTSKKLTEAREAIIDYWHNVSGVEFDDYRWDIYPLGFDKTDNSRILVTGYAYTGGVPVFLGTWAVDVTGERTQLIDLEGTNYQVSIVGYKLAHDSYVSRAEVEWENKRQEKIEKSNKRKAKQEIKKVNKAKKEQYKKKLKELKMQYRLRVQEYKKNRKDGMSGVDGDIFQEDGVNNGVNERVNNNSTTTPTQNDDAVKNINQVNE